MFSQRGEEQWQHPIRKMTKKKFKKEGKALKDQNALKNVCDSLNALTQILQCILHDERLIRIPRTEFNIRQVFLWKLDDSGLIPKYGNYRFSLLFFILRKNGKEFCKTDCKFRLPDPDSL